MKIASRMAAQGDVLFRRVAALPDDARELPHHGTLVVAHSETGHHHVIRSAKAALYRNGDPLVSYLRIDAPFVDIEHQRAFDTHETLRLLGRDDGPTFFEVRRQREHMPERWLPVND